jgi:PAS domain S-box-containing protein
VSFSRDQLAGIVAASPLAIHSIDLDGLVTSWNAAAERLYGWTAADAIGHRLPMVSEQDRAEFDHLCARVRAGEMVIGAVVMRTHKDGHRVTVALSVAPLFDERGEVVGSVGFTEDLAARERMLAEQAHHLRVILDAIPAPIFYKDTAGIYRGCNKAFEAYLGRSRDDVVGKDVYGLSPKDLADVYKRADDELFARRGVQIYEAALRYADGSRHDVMFHKATFDDADGNLAGLIGTVLDITTRKQAEQALRASEQDLATTLDSIGDGVISTDASGAIVRMNPVAERLTGWPLEAARGRLLAEVFRVEPVGPVLGLKTLRTRDGGTRPIASSSSPKRDAAGNQLGSVTVLRDMTDEVRAREGQRVMQERLALADRLSSVGTLAAGVAHEINNPLSYVLGNLSLLADELRRPAPRTGEMQQLVAEALDGGERIRRIVRDLKSFARAEDDVHGPLDVRRVLELAINLAANEIRHRARLVREYAEVAPVDGNESRLGQVFVNLLINAAQAIPEGEADRHEIRLVCRGAERRVIVEVHDTGCGIPAPLLGRIFEPFFTTKPVGTGTGLGLSTCHGIVTAMGGELEVESVLGRGSTFRVVLLASSAPMPVRPAAAPQPGPAPRRGRILVVDDEPIVSRTLKRFLEAEHDVVTAANGRQALDALDGDRFDAILCDLMMPEMTGMDVHAALVERDPALADRMIFMTGGAFTARARDFLDRVRNPRLEKPFTMATISAMLRELVR